MNGKPVRKIGKKEGRSPGYPSISLEVALGRAQILKDREPGRHFAHISTIFEYWGYGSKSSTGLLTLAALKKFGLIEDRGAKETREAKISDLAWRILEDNRPNSAERAALIQEAALRPPVHRKLWNDYKGQLPSDETLRYRLRTTEKFTLGAVDDFIREFRATIAFAKLEWSDSILGYEEDKPPAEEDYAMPSARDVSRPDQPASSPTLSVERPKTGEQKFEVGLSDGQITYFRAPPSLKAEDWQKIRSLINVLAPNQKDVAQKED